MIKKVSPHSNPAFFMKDAYFSFLLAMSLCLCHAAFGQPYLVEQISENPRMFLISHFLSDEECDYVISYATPGLVRSTVFDERTQQRKVDPVRTSSSMRFADQHADAIIEEIEKRISTFTSLAESQGENMQVAHYQKGGKYSGHYDYFKNVATQEGGQRIATFLMYLNTPEKGGETSFPLVNISIRPVKGTALFFYNVDAEGVGNPLTLHVANPVIAGDKWIMTRWFRERPLR